MRYSSALVLSTWALGQAAAGNVRHASFHARRQAEAKRNMEDVNWATVAYDLSGVNWSSVFVSPSPTPVAAAPSSAPEVPTSAPAAANPEPTSKAAASPTSEKAPAKTESSNPVGEFISDLTEGLENIISKIGVLTGTNAQSSSGGSIWHGSDSKWKATFINDGDDDIALVCWGKTAGGDSYGGMAVGKNAPLITAAIPAGKKLQLSFAESFPCVCGPAYPGTTLNFAGQLGTTWLEMNFVPGNGMGAFDVSREITMSGPVMSAKGSKCTSGVKDGKLACTFGCTNGKDVCGDSGTYNIFGAEGEDACMVGKDPSTKDPSGGCGTGADGEELEVTLYGKSISWPS